MFAGALVAGALAGTALLQGCGTKVATPLPDTTAKNAVPDSGVKPKTTAEQKQAIDALIAKREAQKNP